jgi:hypothetical protein
MPSRTIPPAISPRTLPIERAPPYASPISRVFQWNVSEKILATVTAGRIEANPYCAA